MRTWRFLLRRLGEQLWPRSALFTVVGVATALLAAFFDPLVPKGLAKSFGGGTVSGLLNILASSLLAVATFSATALLTAFTNIASNGTPRAAMLVAGDRSAQTALATFIGAFLYAVVGVSALGTGYYAEGGRAILFFVTLVVLAIVAVTLLRWLDHLVRLARVENAVIAVERNAAEALASPFGPAAPRTVVASPADAQTIVACQVGLVQNVDIEALHQIAEARGMSIWIRATPGCFTISDTVLVDIDGTLDEQGEKAIRAAFTIGEERSMKQDPQYGLIVLGEIGAKALSAAVNNPGLAKDVITSIVRLLEDWLARGRDAPAQGDGPVHWCAPSFTAVVEDALLPVASSGAGSVTLAIRLQNVLAALTRVAPPAEAQVLRAFALETLARSDKAIDHEPDRARIRAAAGLSG